MAFRVEPEVTIISRIGSACEASIPGPWQRVRRVSAVVFQKLCSAASEGCRIAQGLALRVKDSLGDRIPPQEFLDAHTGKLSLSEDEDACISFASFELAKDLIKRPAGTTLNGRPLLDHLKELAPTLDLEGEDKQANGEKAVVFLIKKVSADYNISYKKSCQLLFMLLFMTELFTYPQERDMYIVHHVTAEALEKAYPGTASAPREQWGKDVDVCTALVVQPSSSEEAIEFTVSQSIAVTDTITDQGIGQVPSHICFLHYDSRFGTFQKTIRPINCQHFLYELLPSAQNLNSSGSS